MEVEVHALTVNGNKQFISHKITTNVSVALLKIQFVVIADCCGPEYCSRYNDSLRTGRSGNQILVWMSFFAPFQHDPGAHPASCKMSTGSVSWE